MGLRLARNLGAPYNLDAAEFCLDAGEVFICCPICSCVTPLDQDKHSVDLAGKVTPAWHCPMCPCLEWLELGSYGDEP